MLSLLALLLIPPSTAAFRLHPGADANLCVESVYGPRAGRADIVVKPCLPLDIGITHQDWQWGGWPKYPDGPNTTPRYYGLMEADNEEAGEWCMSFGDLGISDEEFDSWPPPRSWSPKNGDKGIMYWCAGVGDYANNGNGWDYVDNTYLKIQSTNFCLDLTDGRAEPGNKVQIWECFCGNPNQAWTMTESGPFVSSEVES